MSFHKLQQSAAGLTVDVQNHLTVQMLAEHARNRLSLQKRAASQVGEECFVCVGRREVKMCLCEWYDGSSDRSRVDACPKDHRAAH